MTCYLISAEGRRVRNQADAVDAAAERAAKKEEAAKVVKAAKEKERAAKAESKLEVLAEPLMRPLRLELAQRMRN